MAKRKKQSDHDSMVETLVNHLQSSQYQEIKADLHGYIQPTTLHWKDE